MSQMAKYRLKMQKARRKQAEEAREAAGKGLKKVKVLNPDSKTAEKLEKGKK